MHTHYRNKKNKMNSYVTGSGRGRREGPIGGPGVGGRGGMGPVRGRGGGGPPRRGNKF